MLIKEYSTCPNVLISWSQSWHVTSSQWHISLSLAQTQGVWRNHQNHQAKWSVSECVQHNPYHNNNLIHLCCSGSWTLAVATFPQDRTMPKSGLRGPPEQPRGGPGPAASLWTERKGTLECRSADSILFERWDALSVSKEGSSECLSAPGFLTYQHSLS